MNSKNYIWENKWGNFKTNLPHQQLPFSKKNWGHKRHSMCSYQGKLKPAIASHLVDIFVPEKGSILDTFSGVGTIPFEAALANKKSFGFDISLPAFYISSAKVGKIIVCEVEQYINHMDNYILGNKCTTKEIAEVENFGLNRVISEYYEVNTLREIILARRFIKLHPPKNSSEMAVISSLMHILHGNRPYALSRRSHSITPYAPTGDFEYKNLITKLREKIYRVAKEQLPDNFTEGKIYMQDATAIWPDEIDNLDAIITSPPFFDSTRFYSANWLRLWFSGWSKSDFTNSTKTFLEERQKKDMTVYDSIFSQSYERLKKGGVCVFHLGKSKKCDMAQELKVISSKWFKHSDIFDESVTHCKSFGIKDIGTVTAHQYLILTK